MKKLARHIFLSFVLLLCILSIYAQNIGDIDSLKRLIEKHKEDTNKVKLLYTLSFSYAAGSYADTALVYSQRSLDLAEKLNYEHGIFWSMLTSGESLAILGNYPRALEYDFRALELAKKSGEPLKLCYGNGSLAGCYYYMGDYNSSLKYASEVLKIMEPLHRNDKYWMWTQMSKSFHSMGSTDSALLYAKKAYDAIKQLQFLYAKSVIAPILGNAYAGKANYDSALLYYQMGIPLSLQSHTETHLIDNYYGIATVYKFTGNLDSSLWYCKKILNEKITKAYPAGLLKAANLLTDIYELKNNSDSSLKYFKVAAILKDSLNDRQKTIAVQNLIYKEQEKQKEIEAVKIKFSNQLKIYFLIAVLLILMTVVILFVKRQRQKQIERIRNSIAADLHDDIGSTLSSISIMSELAKARSPQASTLLTSIGESTMTIQENMSDIVWAINSKNDSFENTLQRMNQFASEILDAKNIDLDFSSDGSVSTSRLTMKQRKNFYLFFKEVINNAAKHSDATSVFVSIYQKEHQVEMIVKDNGKGFDTDQAFNGNGMQTLKKRMEQLGGDLKIHSQLNQGTTVKIRFKVI